MAVKVSVRFSDEEFELLKEYAEDIADGNVSRVVRALCAEALAGDETKTAVEHRVEAMLEKSIARMERIASKSAKAALANLALSCSYMPALGDGMRAIGGICAEGKKESARKQKLEEIDAALYTISGKEGISQNALFDWAWDAGGRLQAQKGRPSLHDATKGK